MKTNARPSHSNIEILESRIAPAAVYHYMDENGSAATITTSMGTNAELASAVHFTNHQLTELDLSYADFGNDFAGADVTITAGFNYINHLPHGDGLVNVGQINATGINLGTVSVKGDLDEINAGADTPPAFAVGTLSVLSYGQLNVTTGATSLESDFLGGLGILNVKTNVDGVLVKAFGNIFDVSIGGSLIGGSTDFSGLIQSTGNIHAVTIDGSIVGGSAPLAGGIYSGGTLGNVTVLGSLTGGSADCAGSIVSVGDMATLGIHHDVVGAGGAQSGYVASGQTFNGTAFVDSPTPGSIEAIVVVGSIEGGVGNSSGAFHTSGGMGILANPLGSVSIAGNLRGGAGPQSGSIQSESTMGVVFIGGDVTGGSGGHTGLVAAQTITNVTVAGSLIGGSNLEDGFIATNISGNLGPVKIGGSIQGGNGSDCGSISAGANLSSVTISKSVIGSTGTYSGSIGSAGKMGAVSITQDLQGGAGGDTGSIISDGALTAVKIGGSVIGGSSGSDGCIQSGGNMGTVVIGGAIDAGSAFRCGGIFAGGAITSVQVKGSLVGNSAEPVFILANGPADHSAASDVAIGSITVSGDVTLANILAGYTSNPTTYQPANGNAQISQVKVGGDWIESNLVAGAENLASSNVNFGNSNDAQIPTSNTTILAKIASITIGGQVEGNPADSNSSYGFVAQEIGTFSVGGSAIALNPGPNNDTIPIGATGSIEIHEV